MLPRFDTFPTQHTALAFALAWGLLGWVAIGTKGPKRWFLPITLVVFFVLRLPSIVYNQELNPDESQLIAQGMTLGQYDPVYFRSVDGATSGPLDSYAIILPTWVGLSYDYVSARLFAYFLLAVSLGFLFFTARRWTSDQPAQVSLLAVVFVLGFTQNSDLLHYSSELVSILLLSWAGYLYARQTTQPKPIASGQLLLIGFLLGVVPFGKLQAVPMAAVLGLFSLLDVWFRSDLLMGQKTKHIGALAVGGLLFPALFVGFMLATGQFQDFVNFYLLGNLNYGNGGGAGQNIVNLPRFLALVPEIRLFLVLTGIVCLLAIGVQIGRKVADNQHDSRLAWSIPAFLVLSLAVALYAVTRTGYDFVHYLLFLIGPLFLLLANGLQALPMSKLKIRPIVAILVVALLLADQTRVAAVAYRTRQAPYNPYPSDQQQGWQLPTSPLAQHVRRYARAGEPLAVWGWRCDYYVQTQMPQGVAETNTVRSVFKNPLQAVCQQRYVQNMARTLPPVFVDAVGRYDIWITNRATQGHEMYPPLKALIAKHYQLADTVSDSRIYVRRDRLAQLK